MRLLHFGKYAFGHAGGMERHVELLTRGLAARGADVWVVAYDPSGRAEPAVIDGVHVEPVRPLVHFGSQAIAPALFSRAARLSRQGQFDVVHQHWPDPFAHVAASVAAKGAVHVATWHSDILRQRYVGAAYRFLGPRLLRRPDAVIGATSAHLASSQVDAFAPPERRHVVAYGVDMASLRLTDGVRQRVARLRERYGNRPLVFALGRHVYYKGFDVLIRAMAEVPAVLLLGGDGPLSSELRSQAARTGAAVEFLGAIPEVDLAVYFHACDVYCMPSVAATEAFGLVQVEAMACGKPVVNTWLGNGVNLVAPDGLVASTVQPGDAAALAAALRRILEDPALAARLGEEGRKRAVREFSVDAMVGQTMDLYTNLLRDRKG